ncbi:MAG: radical SAM protein [Nitrospiraceae bacterium]|nr:MAG: radical SAM protein [Nitrospiraceae bacterium]
MQIKVGPTHNYVAFFLTLSCNLRCRYCINLHSRSARTRTGPEKMSADDWINAANRLVLRDDLPLTIQGGEPTLYKGFYRFVNEVREDIKMDLLTNMSFDADEFIRKVPVRRFSREAPYAAIRVSYHPGQNDIEELIRKTIRLQAAGFRTGIYSVVHPEESGRAHIMQTMERCLKLGIDFRTKEFLGEWNGVLYGTYKYDDSVCGGKLKKCDCRTTEVLVDPAGYVHRCHADLYKGRQPVGHILDDDFTVREIDKFRSCSFYGDCNPCDVKIKTNRLQIFGHTSVEIKNLETMEHVISHERY